MRAIQIERVRRARGPEARRRCRPRARARARCSIRVRRAGHELRRHPPAHERLRAHATSCRWSPAARWRACARTPGERVVALCGTGGYAEYATAPAALTLPDPRRRRRRHRARADRPGPDRLAPVPHLARRWRRASRVVVHAAAGRRRLAGRPARQADGRRARDRHGLDRGEARAGARAGRRRGDRRLARGHEGAPGGGQRRPTVDVVFEMAGGEVFDAVARRAGAVRAPRHLRDRLARAANEVSSGRADAHARARSSASGSCTASGARRWSTRPSPTCSRASQRGELRVRVGRTYPLAEAARRPDRPGRAPHHGQAAAGPRRLDSSLPMTAFADLGLSETTLAALRDVGYESPSPIQEQAIPPLLEGARRDRPGPDRHRQDRRLRAADDRVRRSRRATPCRRSCSRRRGSCASRSPRRCAPTARARASTSWPCSAAPRSAPSRRSSAPGGQIVVGHRRAACST